MDNNGFKIEKTGHENLNREKILLIMLPFWTPLIPAQGIASLKGFLQRYGYKVKAVDATSENSFLELYNEYFETIKEFVPRNHRGNFYNLGHDVLRDHMMAHTNYTDEKEYFELVKILIARTYYCDVNDTHISKLNKILDRLFSGLEAFTLKLLEEERPAVLGLSATSENLASTRFVFELTRKKYPLIKTIMGGCVFYNHLALGNPDVDAFLEKTRSYIDKVIIGKGEILFLKYLKGELPRSQRVYTGEDLDKEREKPYFIDIPDLSDYDLQRHLYLAASASSSCPHRCSFCNSRAFFGKFRKKEPGQTIKEIMKLQERYGHKMFFMTDALLNPMITDLTNEIIKRDLVVYLDGYFTVDYQGEDIENTLSWRRGGFYRARLGAESGSQRVLDAIGKKITPAQTKRVISNLAHAGIKTTTYWVIGHPGETEEDFQLTLDLLEELKNDIWQAECNPFRYYYTGMINSEKWAGERKFLYPGNVRHMLMTQTWYVDGAPSREEIYKRIFRFTHHCKKLGIPNPYSFDEIYDADKRWKRLHKNAVPPIMEIMDDTVDFDERQKVEKLLSLENNLEEEGDFCFQTGGKKDTVKNINK